MKYSDINIGGIYRTAKNLEWGRTVIVVDKLPPNTIIVKDFRGNNHIILCGKLVIINIDQQTANICNLIFNQSFDETDFVKEDSVIHFKQCGVNKILRIFIEIKECKQ